MQDQGGILDQLRFLSKYSEYPTVLESIRALRLVDPLESEIAVCKQKIQNLGDRGRMDRQTTGYVHEYATVRLVSTRQNPRLLLSSRDAQPEFVPSILAPHHDSDDVYDRQGRPDHPVELRACGRP